MACMTLLAYCKAGLVTVHKGSADDWDESQDYLLSVRKCMHATVVTLTAVCFSLRSSLTGSPDHVGDIRGNSKRFTQQSRLSSVLIDRKGAFTSESNTSSHLLVADEKRHVTSRQSL